MEVVGNLVPADGVHVGDQTLAHGEVVVVQGQTLPLSQGVDHLGVPLGGGHVEGDGALHAVQVVVQAGGGLHKQGGGDPAQVEVPAEGVLKDPLEQGDGLLGVIQVQQGRVVSGDIGFGHSDNSFRVV